MSTGTLTIDPTSIRKKVRYLSNVYENRGHRQNCHKTLYSWHLHNHGLRTNCTDHHAIAFVYSRILNLFFLLFGICKELVSGSMGLSMQQNLNSYFVHHQSHWMLNVECHVSSLECPSSEFPGSIKCPSIHLMLTWCSLDADLTLNGIGGVENKCIEASLQHLGKEDNNSPGLTLTLALGLHACMKNTLGLPCNVGMSATSDMRFSSLHAFFPWLSHRNPPLISPTYMNSELHDFNMFVTITIFWNIFVQKFLQRSRLLWWDGNVRI